MEENIYKKLTLIQSELKAPKNQENKFGGYKYRSCEDIVEAAKPIINKYELNLTLTDDVVLVGERVYVKASAVLTDLNGNTIKTVAFAREPDTQKGMSDSQVTGAASSYARKYALNGLFAIDDTKDADTNEYQNQQKGSTKSQHKENILSAESVNALAQYKIDISRLANYLKKDVLDVTDEDVKKAVEQKKAAASQAKKC